METFRLDWGRSWWVRLFGRNKLVRGSDRLEACCVTLAVITVIAALPVSAAWGTSVHDVRRAIYAQQWLTRHHIEATAIEDAHVGAEISRPGVAVPAHWTAGGRTHAGTVSPPDMVHAGDRFTIWVDDNGDLVRAPTPPGQAVSDAVGAAVLSWLAVTSTMALPIILLRRRLTRARYGEWDRELDALAGNGGGRANR